jgi:hypothetical protein
MKKAPANIKPVNTQGHTRSNAHLVERQNSLGAHICVQREAAGLGVQPHAPALVREVLKSPGQPLDMGTRSLMEPRFGCDFSGVRVHTDEAAAESARAVSAKAYTAGSHVVFGARRHEPDNSAGQHVMAHELTHVVQQASGPVVGTTVEEGFSISHPDDHFEREASAMSGGLFRGSRGGRAGSGVTTLSPSISDHSPVVVQRQVNDTSGTGAFTARQTSAAETSASAAQTSATAGVASAIAGGFSALGALVSGFEAIRQANFAERSAVAAEDPPVAEPTTGGVSSTHVELPEVKGIDKDDLEGKVESTEEDEEQTVTSGLKGGEKIPEEEKLSITKQLKTRKHTKKTKKADDPDEEASFKVLRLQQGADSAEFLLTLRHNHKDVKGGATEDGEINGYLGGSAQSNASVTFRASPGALIKPGKAGGDKGGKGLGSVRLLFGGTNVPPRKRIGISTGFLGLGKGGTEENKNYKVQRFSGSATFSGNGELVGAPAVRYSPQGSGSTMSPGDGKTAPVVTIGLNSAPSAASASGQPKIESSSPQKAGGGASAPTGGGGGK